MRDGGGINIRHDLGLQSQRGYIVSHKIMKIVTVGVEKDGTQSGEKYQSGMYVSTSLTSLSS